MSSRTADGTNPLARLGLVATNPLGANAMRHRWTWRQLERFRVINGLSANDRLGPGEKVKIVVE